MTLTSATNDLVEEASRILFTHIDLDDWRAPDGVDSLEAYEQAEQAERDRRLRAAIDRWCADRADRLLAIRHVHNAALARVAAYKAEMALWERRAKRQQGLVDYCAELATNVLEAERALRGGKWGEPIRVELSNGLRMGLRVSQSVLAPDVDVLPPEYVRVVPARREPDKIALAKALKAGANVPGAELVPGESLDWGKS